MAQDMPTVHEHEIAAPSPLLQTVQMASARMPAAAAARGGGAAPRGFWTRQLDRSNPPNEEAQAQAKGHAKETQECSLVGARIVIWSERRQAAPAILASPKVIFLFWIANDRKYHFSGTQEVKEMVRDILDIRNGFSALKLV